MSRDWHGRRASRLTALVLATYGTTCHLCRGAGATTADHVIPRSRGGPHSLANMRPAHHGCNSARGDMDLTEWFRRHPEFARRSAAPPSRRWFG
ncbi:HNH endonuclease [Nocardia wallacei]|uniref:HNH endonuclease n=1 Tax=Nocardia wallacei TaxID=480035 RepID=UPI002453F7DC|nr:HNH endonuclease [Nocardia wallacei]